MKRIVTIILLLSLPYIVGCAQSISKQPIKQDTVMQRPRATERYDFEATQNGTIDVITEENGWIIEKWKMTNNGMGFYKEYAPAKDFYKIVKWFYSNGVLRKKYFSLAMRRSVFSRPLKSIDKREVMDERLLAYYFEQV